MQHLKVRKIGNSLGVVLPKETFRGEICAVSSAEIRVNIGASALRRVAR